MGTFQRSLFFCVVAFFFQSVLAQKIDRKKLVQRHTIQVFAWDSLASLSVGNGKFAFTTDITGLQSFPDASAGGVPLGTQSEWGWHSFPNHEQLALSESFKAYDFNGRPTSYAIQWKDLGRQKKAADYFRQNLHRLQLGNIGLEIILQNGSLFKVSDVKEAQESLDMWTGRIHARFKVEGHWVEVHTYCDQQQDVVSTRIQSDLIRLGRLRIRLQFPYPTGEWSDRGNRWDQSNQHQSALLIQDTQAATIQRTLDTNIYFVRAAWKTPATFKQDSPHRFLLTPNQSDVFECSIGFDPTIQSIALPTFAAVKASNEWQWPAFWQSGAAVDFSGSTDGRAKELERRVICSQYLTKIQCSGNQPPQETGLTYNSWYGKPHLEMHWWHGVHFALWGRPSLLEKSLTWYQRAAPLAKAIAVRQGFDGIRWQKMTDPEGRESPSSVGAFLIWQQPHFIYFAELLYQNHPQQSTLHAYANLVFQTADFMASYAFYDSTTSRFRLGPGVIPAQERFPAVETFNPTFELIYWHWALNTAQKWRGRLGLPPNDRWDLVVKNLAAPKVQDGKYLFAESALDSYTNPRYRTDHPAVLGALGMLSRTHLIQVDTMRKTLQWIMKHWEWNETWGWDFPMVAMTATRLGLPEIAVNALMMPIQTNTYLVSGHNYQDGRLTLYLPGNGGLLSAVALMCTGDRYTTESNPGFPKQGWKVKWEGLQRIPE
jgi:protein-glucosylgalactosylhydroxylysine glucosidase